MATPEEDGPQVAGSTPTENGVPPPRDQCVRAPQGTDATAVVTEEGGRGGESGDDTAATTTAAAVKAVGIDPSEHQREEQNDLENSAGRGLGNGAANDIRNGAGDGTANDTRSSIGHDAGKATPASVTGETSLPAGRPARRLSESLSLIHI